MIDAAWMQPGTAATVAFATLTLAFIALWWPRSANTPPVTWWGAAFAVSLVAAGAGELVDSRGLLALLAFGAVCLIASHARHRTVSVIGHALMLLLCAGLFLHIVPGFQNPLALDAVVLGPGAAPYTKYLSFDKGVAGLFLLGLYAPARTALDPLFRRAVRLWWQFALLALVELSLSVALGFVRWDPKLPGWWAAWVWSMVFLTALPEEAIFRGVAQHWVAERLRAAPSGAGLAPVIAGTLFGVAHLEGGPAYVVLATVAGIGYGWIYGSSGSIAAAIAAHAGLNTLHFLLFTYPSLDAATR